MELPVPKPKEIDPEEERLKEKEALLGLRKRLLK